MFVKESTIPLSSGEESHILVGLTQRFELKIFRQECLTFRRIANREIEMIQFHFNQRSTKPRTSAIFNCGRRPNAVSVSTRFAHRGE